MSQSWKGGPSMERNEVKRKVAFKRSLLTVGRRNSPSFQSPAPHSRWTRAMSRWCEFSQTSFLPSTSPKMDPGGRWTWFPMCKLKISSSISWPKRRFWDSGAGWCWWCWMGFNGGSFHNRIPGVFVLAVVHWYTRLCLQRDLLHCYTFIHFLYCRYLSIL